MNYVHRLRNDVHRLYLEGHEPPSLPFPKGVHVFSEEVFAFPKGSPPFQHMFNGCWTGVER